MMLQSAIIVVLVGIGSVRGTATPLPLVVLHMPVVVVAAAAAAVVVAAAGGGRVTPVSILNVGS